MQQHHWAPPHDGQPHRSGEEKYARMHRVALARALLLELPHPVAGLAGCSLNSLVQQIVRVQCMIDRSSCMKQLAQSSAHAQQSTEGIHTQLGHATSIIALLEASIFYRRFRAYVTW
jgi:hypothetical protein